MVSSYHPHSMCKRVERVTVKTGRTSCTNWTISFGVSGFRTRTHLLHGLFNVFYTNFLGFIRRWAEEKTISEACYQRLRKKLLLEFFSIWVTKWKYESDQYVFSDENLPRLIKDAYHSEKYYPVYLIRLLKNRLISAVLPPKGGET